MNGLLQTLALSLLHALWELALLGLLAWGGLGLLRHRGAAAQYGLACVFLLAMLLAPVCTFVLLDAGGTELVAGVLQAPVLEASGAAAGPRSALAALAPWVAWGWMAGSALMLLRLQTLATGHTGVRPVVVDTYAAMLDAGISRPGCRCRTDRYPPGAFSARARRAPAATPSPRATACAGRCAFVRGRTAAGRCR